MSVNEAQGTISIHAPAQHLPMRIRLASPLSDDALFERSFPYVMGVHQAPTIGAADGAVSPSSPRQGHLHVEFYPPLRTADKLKYLAGSEQGAGSFISDTLPEESAAMLRAAIARAA